MIDALKFVSGIIPGETVIVEEWQAKALPLGTKALVIGASGGPDGRGQTISTVKTAENTWFTDGHAHWRDLDMASHFLGFYRVVIVEVGNGVLA